MFRKVRLIKEVFDVGYEITHTKNWYTSKTIWYNILVILSYFIVNKYGDIIGGKENLEAIALALAAVGNIFLRFKTRRPVSLRSKGDADSGEVGDK